jgi:hypothetical protein
VHENETEIRNELQPMATLDDVDEDEAFILELMSMHPNDDDIIIEDLSIEESVDETPVTNIPTIFIDHFNNGEVSDVRNTNKFVCSFCVLEIFALEIYLFSFSFYISLVWLFVDNHLTFIARNFILFYYFFHALFYNHEPFIFYYSIFFSLFYDFFPPILLLGTVKKSISLMRLVLILMIQMLRMLNNHHNQRHQHQMKVQIQIELYQHVQLHQFQMD